MFLEKTKKEFDGMSADEQATYLVEKRTHDASVREAEIKTAIAEAQKQSDEASKLLIDGLNAELKTVKDNLEEFALRMKAMNEKPMTLDTFESKVLKSIVDNQEAIKSVASQGSGMVELFTAKEVDTIDTTYASNPNGIHDLVGVQTASPSNVNLRSALINSLVTTIPTSSAAYAYTESLPKDGDFSFVAEKGSKPQIDLSFETRYATPVKVAAYERLTMESVQDIPNLQSIARDFLRKKHDLRKEKGLINGSGISPNPKGATLYGRSFVAGAMAGAVANVNLMDVINACITDIYTTHNFQDEVPYMANVVMINPMDFFTELVSAKDDNGLPLYPSASLFNRVVIGGVTIIPHEDIAVGKIFVSDLSKYNTTDYMGYSVKIGWVNDDFIKNQFVMVGESRFHAFVKKLDEQAFIFDDIAIIKALIEVVPAP